ncbi:antibiotic biosynthesis monooxygenase [Streptomyces sp. CAU 1734]|uniref:antibiotic biosynthesis monooxygenase family protein n=1 Tax=Streptomyces sp. CAU 1734 TaxID=3140360 RepID=UPI0032613043
MTEENSRPVSAPEPPYYTVVFTSKRTANPDGYEEAARRMAELVRQVPGFLGMESAHVPGGLGITVGYFRDLEAIAGWQRDPEHQEAQRRGRAEWYQYYSVHIGRVERGYSFERRE